MKKLDPVYQIGAALALVALIVPYAIRRQHMGVTYKDGRKERWNNVSEMWERWNPTSETWEPMS